MRKGKLKQNPEDWSDSEVEDTLDFDLPCMQDVTIDVARELLVHCDGRPRSVYAILEHEDPTEWESKRRTPPDFSVREAPDDDYSPDTCSPSPNGIQTEHKFIREPTALERGFAPEAPVLLKFPHGDVVVHPPSRATVSLLRDASQYLTVMNRVRAVRWLTEIDHTGKPYETVLKGFVAAGARREPSAEFQKDVMSFLKCVFPLLRKGKDVRPIVDKVRWDIPESYQGCSELMTRRESRGVAHEFQRKKVEITDPWASFQILECLKLEPDVLESSDSEVAKFIAKECASLANSYVQCECCWSFVVETETLLCQHGHRVCFQCLIMWGWSQVTMGEGKIECIASAKCDQCEGDRCVAQYFLPDLARALPPSLLEQLTRLEGERVLKEAKLKNLVKCAHCGVVVVYLKRTKSEKIFECPECSGRTCLKCRKREHPGFSCREARNVTPNMLASKITAKVVRTCPGCGLEFLKEQGCNKMECPSCHAVMCYVCKKRIYDKNPYSHFSKSGKEPGKCPLYVQNWAFNRKQVKQATQELNELATQLREENERNNQK